MNGAGTGGRRARSSSYLLLIVHGEAGSEDVLERGWRVWSGLLEYWTRVELLEPGRRVGGFSISLLLLSVSLTFVYKL